MERAIRVWETVKTVLIVLLLCTLAIQSVALISELVTGQSLPRRLGMMLGWIEPEPEYVQTGESIPAAAQPLAISMTGSNGRGSTAGDVQRTAELYESMSRQLGEALATARMPVALEEQSWRSLLSGESVSFLFPGEIPLNALAKWLGAQAAESLTDVASSVLTLCVDGQQVSLLLRTDYWMCFGTGVSTEQLRQSLEQCRPDGSLFAMEDESMQRIDPLSLLMVRTEMPGAVSENALSDADRINAAAAQLGLNPYRDTAYTSADGTVSFTTGSGRLQITATGVLQYTPAVEDRLTTEDDDIAIIESARLLLGQLSEELIGDASLQLRALERDGRRVTVRFDYVLSGYSVWQSDGAAAELVYEWGALTELTWAARCYTRTEQTEVLLPARQAVAIVSEGTRLEPIYLDGGSGLRSGWPS